MSDWLSALFSSKGIPHGYCIAWEPQLLWTMVIGNGLVALAYFTIPLALYRFLRMQPGLPFGWMFLLFSGFIFFCGVTHVVNIVNLWHPLYRLDGALMAMTAGLSVATAAVLFPAVGRASVYLDAGRAQGRELQRLNSVLQQASEDLHIRNHELETSERRFRQTLENAPIGLAVVGIDGRFLEVNQALSQIVGYSLDELRQMVAPSFTLPEDLDRIRDHFRRLVAGEMSSYRLNQQVAHRQGHKLSIQVDVSLLREANGRPLHFIVQIQDITERQRVEQALRTRELQARTLGELDEMLQICQQQSELGPPVAKACLALYPDCSGVLYVRNASRNWVETLHAWGQPMISEPVFAPEECWALRKGHRAWLWRDEPHRHRCKHLGPGEGDRSARLCLPLLAQGEVIGLLHLQLPEPLALKLDLTEYAAGPIEHVASRVGVALANLQLLESLRFQSIRDPLTSLHNRRHLQESLIRDLARAERDGSELAVMMIDIDHFKAFNDQHGHVIGDTALKQVALAIGSFCRRGDLACRYGGEEFTAAMSVVDEVSAYKRAEVLCHLIERMRIEIPGGQELSVTVSIGLAVYPRHANNLESLLGAADEALYRAKRLGRNRVVSAGQQSASLPMGIPSLEPPPR
jgi:diguanylate cyclase (GGDEF)-like protein/PAS domain S-box-containing protein